MTERALRFRNPVLVVGIIGYVYDSDEPVPWDELVGTFTSDERPWKTVENTLYELQQFGALQRVGRPGGKGKKDTRALKPTTLGRAWLDRELVPIPGHDDDELEEIARDFADSTLDADDILPIHDLTPGSEPR